METESDEESDGYEYSPSDNDDDMSGNPNAAPMNYKVPSQPKSGIIMMKAEEILPEMARRCSDVCEVLGITTAAAGVLLRRCDWSKAALLEKYMNDHDKFLRESGVYYRCGQQIKHPINTSLCQICYDENDKMYGMRCGHTFCLGCWEEFCENAINEGTNCVNTTCPQAECNELVTEEEMKQALGESSTLFQKYLTYQLRSYVEKNRLTRWCPGRGCDRIASSNSEAAMESEGCVAHCVDCSTKFCVRCGEEPHAPIDCKALATWNEKCRNESETANWILANTKSCPKCHSRIEKNQGCNHMTCQLCSHEFCWICMGSWKDHGTDTGGFYKCNRYDDTKPSDGDESNAARAKRDLDRYLHYYKRFHAHQEAQSFAKKQLKETELRMVLMQESTEDARWTDVEFLKLANERLVECRRVLKYTYVFAYYLDSKLNRQRETFEYHQDRLERFTEDLSEASEKPLHEIDRTNVVNKTRVIGNYMKNVFSSIDGGLDVDEIVLMVAN